jgi:hypothetical protein
MQNGVKRSSTQPVSVPGELLGNPSTVDWSFRTMMKDVEPDEPGIKGSVIHIDILYRSSLSNQDSVPQEVNKSTSKFAFWQQPPGARASDLAVGNAQTATSEL